MKIKALLYCCKAKPYLEYKQIPRTLMEFDNSFEGYICSYKRTEADENFQCNGKIVAECDYEVEEIRKGWGCLNGTRYFRNNVNHYYPDYELEKQSCLSFDEINNYLKGTLNENCGYAIHIKNLHIFDEPRELSEFTTFTDFGKPITKAPQNMCNVCDDLEHNCERYILISIRPEYLVDILNGNKTIEIRKKILNEMKEQI